MQSKVFVLGSGDFLPDYKQHSSSLYELVNFDLEQMKSLVSASHRTGSQLFDLHERMFFCSVAHFDRTFVLLSGTRRSPDKSDMWAFGLSLEDQGLVLDKKPQMVQAFRSFPFKVASFQITRTFFTVVSSAGRAFAWGRNDFLEIGFKKHDPLVRMKPVILQDPSAKKSVAGSQQMPGRSQDRLDPSHSKSQTNFHSADQLVSPALTRQGTSNIPLTTLLDEASNLAIKAVCSVLSEHVTFYLTSGGLFLAGRRTSNLAPCEKLLKRKREVFGYPHKIPVAVTPQQSILGLSASNSHVLAWDGAGNLFGWGVNLFGCLGVQSNQARNFDLVSVPERVTAMYNSKIVSALALPEVSFAITHQGRLFSWGRLIGSLRSSVVNFDAQKIDFNQPFQEQPVLIKVSGQDSRYMAVDLEGRLFGCGNM
jgi:hypothetical protein